MQGILKAYVQGRGMHQGATASPCSRTTASRQRLVLCNKAVLSRAASKPQPVPLLASDAPIEDAVATAVLRMGRAVSKAETDLAASLRSNWYTTAADVAAMSQDEVQALQLPVRLWSAIKTLLESQHAAAAHDQPAAAAAAGAAGSATEAAGAATAGGAAGAGGAVASKQGTGRIPEEVSFSGMAAGMRWQPPCEPSTSSAASRLLPGDMDASIGLSSSAMADMDASGARLSAVFAQQQQQRQRQEWQQQQDQQAWHGDDQQQQGQGQQQWRQGQHQPKQLPMQQGQQQQHQQEQGQEQQGQQQEQQEHAQEQMEQEAALALSAAAAESELHPDIMQRRAPPRTRLHAKQTQRVTRRQQKERYGLLEPDMTPALQSEFDKLRQFCTQRWFGQRVAPVTAATHAGNERYIRLLLGWLHRHKGVPLSSVSLSTAFPTMASEGIAPTFEWVEWLASERGANARTRFNALSACVHVVRFLYHSEYKPEPPTAGGRQAAPYATLPVMGELRRLVNEVSKEVKLAPLVSDEAKKWLSWDDYIQLVRRLRLECAGLTAAGHTRSRREVASCIQRYLIFAILSCVPDRQRTLRELQVGRTLVKEGTSWVIRHGAADYKTGKLYGERPPLVLAPFLYPELEAFIGEWRAELKPSHQFLFCNVKDGSQLTASRSRGTSEAELEALAMYMGHSLEMQRGCYDRRTRAQKSQPAVDLLHKLSSR